MPRTARKNHQVSVLGLTASPALMFLKLAVRVYRVTVAAHLEVETPHVSVLHLSLASPLPLQSAFVILLRLNRQ